jgi:cellulose synthase operon protein C
MAAKSMVDKYEQILSQDPTSTVFVELAKALIEKGDHARAIDVCRGGLTHHKSSVAGRVLWGKALIQMGRPAEAMEQFDQAIAIDRENPHAYNLIGEVLLQKGLYRSALPLLRKAATLQPNDGRVKQWLEQTQRALAGGPAPILQDTPDPSGEASATPPDSTSERTQMVRAFASDGTPLTGSAPEPLKKSARAKVAGKVGSAIGNAPTGPQAPPSPSQKSKGEDASSDDEPTLRQGARLQENSDEPASQGPRKKSSGAAGAARGRRTATRETVVASVEDVERKDRQNSDQTVVSHRLWDETEGFTATGSPESNEETSPRPKSTSEHAVGDEALAASGAGKNRRPSKNVSERPAAVDDGAGSGSRAPEVSSEPPTVMASGQEVSGPISRSPTGEHRTGRGKPAEPQTAAPEAAPRSEAAGPPVLYPRAQPQDPTEESALPTFDSVAARDIARGVTSTFHGKSRPQAGEGTGSGEPSVVPSRELLDENAGPPPPITSKSTGEMLRFLEEVPELRDPGAAPVLPRVNFSAQATEAIAQEYERELREQLAEKAEVAKSSFLARNWGKLATASVLVVALGVGVVAFMATRAKHEGRDFKDTLAAARKGIAEDTQTSLRKALSSLEIARSMDTRSPEVWALTGIASAMLHAEHGGKPEDKARAVEAMEHPGVKEGFPGIALLVSFHVAEPKAKEALRKEILKGREDSLVEELAGRILLAQKNSEGALKRFRRALELDSRNVRALVALGNYYREAGDFPNALTFYAGDAAKLSPKHPERVFGAAEVRLALEQDEGESLSEVEGLGQGGEVLLPDQHARQVLLHGKLLSATGAHEQALQKLTAGVQSFKSRAFDFQLALGQAYARAGQMRAAESTLTAAMAMRANEDSKQALGRVLLASDRPEEVLRRLPADDSRKVSMVRGAAYVALNDWRRARAELAKTQVAGKFLPEAAIHLALADAAEGNAERAQEVLEKALAVTKKAKENVHLALGNVYWQRGAFEKAQAQFEAAAKMDDGWEGNCALGRLLWVLKQPGPAIAVLEKAVARNDSHDEARLTLVRALLSVGKQKEAQAQAEAWLAAEEPAPAVAFKAQAMAFYFAGQPEQADAPSLRAVKLLPKDGEAVLLRAQVLYARGDVKAAGQTLDWAYKLAPKDAHTGCERGLAAVRQGRYDNAYKIFVATTKSAEGGAWCAQVGTAYARGDKSQLKPLQ